MVSIFIALTALLIVKRNMLWGIMAVIFLPIIGELYRLPFGQDNGTLISDVVIAVLVAVWLFQRVNKKNKNTPSYHNLYKPFLFFCGAAFFSLLLSLTFLKPAEVATGALYLVRLIEYVLLGLITAETVHNTASPQSTKHTILSAITISALIITLAGFIQLAGIS